MWHWVRYYKNRIPGAEVEVYVFTGGHDNHTAYEYKYLRVKTTVLPYHEDTLKLIIRNQENYMRRLRSSTDPELSRKPKRWKIIVFEDSIASTSRRFWNSNVIRRLTMNQRHYNIACMFSQQYPGDMPPSVRSQVDYVFVNQCVRSDMQRMYNYYGGMFENKQNLQDVIEQVSANDSYRWTVIDQTVSSERPEEWVKWYKAQLLPGPWQVLVAKLRVRELLGAIIPTDLANMCTKFFQPFII